MNAEQRKANRDEIRLHKLAIHKLSNTPLIARIIPRIIALPFILLIFLIIHNFTVISNTIKFLLYGGELIAYKKNHTLNEIYNLIQNNYGVKGK